jgi:hypothetical protein
MPPADPFSLTVAPEASAFLDAVGLRTEFDQAIAHARQVIPTLQAVRVSLQPESEDDACLIIEALVLSWEEAFPAERTWWDWLHATFTPEVGRLFALLVIPHSPPR